MAISREEIDQIAEAVANKVLTKSDGNPVKEPMYSQCRCGGAAMFMLSTLSHTIEEYKNTREISPLTKSTMDMAFRELEMACPADMAEVETTLKTIEKANVISEEAVSHAISAMFRGFHSCIREATRE